MPSPSSPIPEELIPRREVPPYLKRQFNLPREIDPATLHRWCLRGVRGVVLRSTMVGGRRYFRRSDIAEFMARINRADAA